MSEGLWREERLLIGGRLVEAAGSTYDDDIDRTTGRVVGAAAELEAIAEGAA